MTTPAPHEQDERSRRSMAQSSEPSAQSLTERQRQLSGREDAPRSAPAEGTLAHIRDRRDEMLHRGAPSLFRKNEREAWFKDFDALSGQIKEAHALWMREVTAGTPPALEERRERIAERQVDRERSQAQSRGIGKKPGEREADVAKMLSELRDLAEKGRQTWAPLMEPLSVDAWRQGRQPKQVMVGRLGYAQYAATAKQESDFMKKYEEQWNRAAQSR